ncbi:MAG: multiheme c-type cytochrome [Pirellulaceae bacterium]|jgi:hypothetical protein|nr:multiheme c-type cytochrome [Pirellulaceae bacterium]MDP7020043.1 multiheme c-type cytochrome [Pirellulaceae bacterium]
MDESRDWGDERDEFRPRRWGRWGCAAAIVTLVVAVVAFFWLERRHEQRQLAQMIDPLGLIHPPQASSDAPRRQFSESRGALGEFLGVDACRDCHAERVESFAETAHFRTSQVATRDNVAGSFERGRDGYQSIDEALRFVMDAEDGLRQTAVVSHEGEAFEYSAPFDVVLGTAKSAQSFLFWRESHLYQLPLSYSAQLDSWTKSPGYPAGLAIFSRAVSSGCLRCHVTFVAEREDAWNSFDRETAIWGISCERCHGPGRDHVAYHQRVGKVGDLAADPIVNLEALPIERQLEICAQCHAGTGEFLRPPFAYRPGEELAGFIRQEPQEEQSLVVHSTNQLARLRLSKCFLSSAAMTCSTCHDVHRHESSDRQLASKKCRQCHQVEDCPPAVRLGSRGRENCIDCHLPTARDQQADLATADAVVYPLMRDHRVAVYPEIAARFESADTSADE